VNCDETLEQLAEYLDEDAREELCRAIEQHLSQCRDCQLFVDTVKKTIVLYHSDRHIEVPASVGSRLDAALAEEYVRAARPASRD